MTSLINFEPFPYQEQIVNHIIENERAAIFAGCGLGKTVSTLCAIDELFARGEIKGVLIVAPLRVTNLTWPMEVEKWGFSSTLRVRNLRPAVLSARTKKQKAAKEEAVQSWENGSADIYVINYEMLQKFCQQMILGRKEIPVDMIVLDESTYLKNHASKRGKALMNVIEYFKRRVLLTGTPVSNGYMDLFAPMRILDDGKRLGRYITHYRNQYFYNPDRRGFTWVVRKGCKEEIQARISDITLVLKSEDYLDIPEMVIEEIEVKLPPDVMTKYRKLEKELLIEWDGSEIVGESASSLINKLLQVCGGMVYDDEKFVIHAHDEKIKALRKLMDRLDGEPLLVATKYRSETERILEEFPEAERFDEGSLDRWGRGEIKMWVSDATAISHGLNLQEGCCTTCWYAPTYSHETYYQYNKRVHRTGQEKPTTVFRLCAVDTIDEVVFEVLRQKEEGQDGLYEALKALQKLREYEI